MRIKLKSDIIKGKTTLLWQDKALTGGKTTLLWQDKINGKTGKT